MAINSFSGLMSSYSPLSDRSATEDEKDLHAGLRSDVEAGDNQGRQDEKKSGRFIDGRTVSDAIIGLSDGMTVPFALTAGLSALGDTKVVVFGGMAELIAGAISMGLGGYLGAKSEEYVYPIMNNPLVKQNPLTRKQGILQGYAEGDTNTNGDRPGLRLHHHHRHLRAL
jgi:hypothetical protein